MSYKYAVSAAERRAAKLLRDQGWRVDEPQCPECHGNGFVYEVTTTNDRIFGSSSASADRVLLLQWHIAIGYG